MRERGVRHRVVKLTLAKLALKQAGIDTSRFDFAVPTSISLSSEDEVTPAKIIHEFAKSHENVKILAGVLSGNYIEAQEVKMLAILPGKQELLGQVAGMVAAPLRGFMSVLSGNLRGLVNVLSAIKDNKS